MSKESLAKLVRAMTKGIAEEAKQGERYFLGSHERNRLAQARKNRKRKVRR
jgi:hypothetical protein